MVACNIQYQHLLQLSQAPNPLTVIPKLLAWYIQYQHTPVTCLPNCWQHISNINIYFYKYTLPIPVPEGHKETPVTYIYLQTVGMVYPISIYISNWIILPKLLAAYIQYNWLFYRNVHFPTLCPKGTKKPSNLHLSPNCWHGISNINIYIQLNYTPQIVGSIYDSFSV